MYMDFVIGEWSAPAGFQQEDVAIKGGDENS
jgi:hypothetical protein